MRCRGAKTENLFRKRYEVFDETPYRRYDDGIVRKSDRESNESDAGTTYRSTFEVTPMHIPDVLLDPKVAAVTGLVGAAGLLFGLRRLEREHGERTTVLMGTMAAFVFAAQMVNFPTGLGVSGHLLGGVLVSVLLGPWAAAVVIAAVLIVQCFLYGDGGLTVLGANFVNMGLIGAVGGYAIYSSIRHVIADRKGILIAAMVAAWFSVLLASGAFAIELGVSRKSCRLLADPDLDDPGSCRDPDWARRSSPVSSSGFCWCDGRISLRCMMHLAANPEALAGGVRQYWAVWRSRWRSPFFLGLLPRNNPTDSSSSARSWVF